MKKENDFGRDSIPLLVLKISIPFMFAQFVNVLYSIVDRIYIGNIPVIAASGAALPWRRWEPPERLLSWSLAGSRV